MHDDNTGWFYVGNGRLRYKSLVGWTDRYQDIDGPGQTCDHRPAGSPDAGGPVITATRRPPAPGDRWLLSRLASAATHRVLAGLFRLAAGPRP